jgi:hypothetical protein
VVPRTLLVKLDEPSRIAVRGSPYEGFIIEPTKSKETGTYAINYRQSPRSIVLTLAFVPTKLTKVERRTVAVAARVKDGKIHVGGMPPEWIKAQSPWVDGPPSSTVHRLPANMTTGAVAKTGNGSPTAPPAKADKSLQIGADVTNDQLRVRLAVMLRQVSALKTELEKRSGLKLRITRDMHIVVDLE